MKAYKKRKLIGIVLMLVSIIFLNEYITQQKSFAGKLIEIVDKDQEGMLREDELKYYRLKIEKELEQDLKNGKNKVRIKRSYYALGAIQYLMTQYDEAIAYFKKALEYTEIINEEKEDYVLDIKICSALSSSYIQKRQPKEASGFFEQAKTIALDNNQSYLLCEVYYGRAKAIGKYNVTEAIDLMRKALEYTDIEEHKVRNYLYLSTLYKLNSKFDLAIEYTLNALEIAMILNEEPLINRCIINLGENYYIQKNYAKTIEMYESLIKSDRLKNRTSLLMVYGYLAECYAKEGYYLKYRAYRDEYLKISHSINSAKDLVWMYLVSAEVEIEYKNKELAKEYLIKGEEIYKKNVSDMYANMDITLEYIKNKIAYLEGAEPLKVIENYNHLLKELNSRGIESDLIDTLIEDGLEIAYKGKEYDIFLNYLRHVKDRSSTESSQAYTDSIFTGVNNAIKEKEFRKARTGLILLCITSIISIYGLISSKRKNIKISKLNQELKELNTIDALTKVYNKGYLNEQFKKIYENKEKVSFMMIDIDYFKRYNDNYGHLKGDKALIEVAQIIKDVFKEDSVFRYGGEEFFIISYKEVEALIPYLEELKKEIYNKNIIHQYSEVSDRITLSIGIAGDTVSNEQQVIELTQKADKNLYQSKEEGRNRYTL